MNAIMVLMLLLGQFPNFFGFPVEAEQPTDVVPQRQPVLYLAIDKDEYSQHLKMELTKNWKDEKPPKRRPDEPQEVYNKSCVSFYNLKYTMMQLNRDINRRVNVELVEDPSEFPQKCPAFRMGKNSKWETFPKEAFRDYTFPLRTVLYEIDRWYIFDWREALEERRLKESAHRTSVNYGIREANINVIEGIYGKSFAISENAQATAIYSFNGKYWDKVLVPDSGEDYISEIDVENFRLAHRNKKLHVVSGYISHYEFRTDIYGADEKIVPTTGLNCRLLPEVFPEVELLPNPPWEPKYSFVPF